MNLLALRTEVLNHGFDPIQYGARVNQYLNDGLAQIARRVDYYVDETTVQVTTVTGAPYFALPADFARVRSLSDTGRNVEMQYASIRDIDRSSSQTMGAPSYYAMTGAALELYPIPDGTYSLMLRYWKMPPALVSDTDVPSLPADYHNLLWIYAVASCFEADDDAQMGGYWRTQFAQGLSMFAADQKFPDSDGPTVVRGMWEPERSLGGSNVWWSY